MNIAASLQSASECYQKGNFDQAEYICREIIRDHPGNIEAYFILGSIFQSRNQFENSTRCYQEIIRRAPHHFGAYFQLGISLYNRRRLDEAADSLHAALRLNPDSEEAYCSLGMIFREQGCFPEAMHCFREAVRLNPASAWAYTNLGMLLQGGGQGGEADHCFRKALEYNPNDCSRNKNLSGFLEDVHLNPGIMGISQKTGNLSILIAVPVWNRKEMVQLSLAQTKRYKTSSCHLQVYNDHSTEFDNTFLEPYADEIIKLPKKTGIDGLRWHQFRAFLKTDFDCLYMTDSDVIHDPSYITLLERLYSAGKRQLPVSLFNSIFTMQPRMILYCKNGIFLKSSAPGNSMLYDRKMVEKILNTLEKTSGVLDYLPWDNKAIACLQLPWITPEMSFLEHFGAQGVNNDNYERDRAISPTEYLQERREPILTYLTGRENLDIDW